MLHSITFSILRFNLVPSIVMLGVAIVLSVIMLSVIIMSGIMLNVVSSSQKSYKPVLLAWHGGQVIQKGAPPLGWILRVSNEAKPLDKLGYFIIVKDFMHISEMA